MMKKSPNIHQENTPIKDKKITIKCTLEERNELHELARKCGYKSLSKYLLDRAKNPVILIENNQPFYDYQTQLSKIGTNVNQVARQVNTYGDVSVEDVRLLQSDIQELKMLFNDLSKEIKANKKSLIRQINSSDLEVE